MQSKFFTPNEVHILYRNERLLERIGESCIEPQKTVKGIYIMTFLFRPFDPVSAAAQEYDDQAYQVKKSGIDSFFGSGMKYMYFELKEEKLTKLFVV